MFGNFRSLSGASGSGVVVTDAVFVEIRKNTTDDCDNGSARISILTISSIITAKAFSKDSLHQFNCEVQQTNAL